MLGMALTALDRWDEVLAEMRVALETDAARGAGVAAQGRGARRQGRLPQAESTLKRAKELDPSNTKADQLLAEIAIARAAGFDGLPAEPTDTKVYPAAPASADPELGTSSADADDRGDRAGARRSGDIARRVRGRGDRGRSRSVGPGAPRAWRRPSQPATSRRRVLRRLRRRARRHRRGFAGRRPRPSCRRAAREESSYEGPATDDYAERARPRVPSLAERARAIRAADADEPSHDADSTMRRPRLPRASRRSRRRRRSAVDAEHPSRRSSSTRATSSSSRRATASRAASRPPSTAKTTRTSRRASERQRAGRRARRHAAGDARAGAASRSAPRGRSSRCRAAAPRDASRASSPRGAEPELARDAAARAATRRRRAADGAPSPYGERAQVTPGVVRVPVKRTRRADARCVRGVARLRARSGRSLARAASRCS